MTNHYTDVCEETIKSLRQQLAAALAAIKIKDEALNSAIVSTEKDFFVSLPKWRVVEALTIQPDDSALKAWLREPSSWTHSCPVLCLDGVELWIDRCPHCGKPAPKGLK